MMTFPDGPAARKTKKTWFRHGRTDEYFLVELWQIYTYLDGKKICRQMFVVEQWMMNLLSAATEAWGSVKDFVKFLCKVVNCVSICIRWIKLLSIDSKVLRLQRLSSLFGSNAVVDWCTKGSGTCILVEGGQEFCDIRVATGIRTVTTGL